MHLTHLLKRLFQTTILLVLCSSLFGETYIVSNTNDSGLGSLRQAIMYANSNPGGDLIEFDIPTGDDNYRADVGVWTIRPETQLPTITDDGLIIDGGTQAQHRESDTNPVGPEIELDGSLLIYGDGLYATEANGIEIFELVINRFFSGIAMSGVEGGTIAGCYIGTDATGMSKAPNNRGISLYSRTRHITIAPREDKPSIISGNPNVGIVINDTSTQNIIMGNIIGLNRTRQDTLGNGWVNRYGGIYITDRSDSNQVIDNDICGNRFAGIYIYHSSRNFIGNNHIGTDINWTLSLGNTDYGVWITSEYANPESTCYNVVMENLIGNNGHTGVLVAESGSFYNTITRNSISNNGVYGILLNKGNNNLTLPTISSATETEITGQAGLAQTVEIFCDEDNEGRIFLGETCTCDLGLFTMNLSSPPPLPKVTATATDTNGNTSMFSVPVTTGIQTNEDDQMPKRFKLEQNVPNPFNASTTICYTIKQPGHVCLTIYDLQGRETKTLIDTQQDPGSYAVHYDAASLVSGIYYYRLRIDSKMVESKKMVLLK